MGACLGSLAALCTWLVVSSGCAPLPPNVTQRALYVDAQKALLGEKRVGWTVDRVEVEEAGTQTEQSACYVREADRKALRKWVSDRITEEGGPARAQFERGADADDLDEVVSLERVGAVLDYMELHVPEDCPFWVKPDPKFKGLHRATNRFVMIAESMGSGALLLSEGKVYAGGGGSARIFLSAGFAQRMQLAAGIEAGGDAIFEKDKTTGKLAPAGAIGVGVPAFLRWNDLDRIYDLELAAIARFEHGRFEPWGARAAFAGGVTGLRRLGFMPALQLWFGYEIFPAQNGLSIQHALRLGTRVGLDYDP